MKPLTALKHFLLLLIICLSAKSYSQDITTGTKDKIYPVVITEKENKAPNEHIEYINNSPYAYDIKMDGTLDGFNTVYYPETYSKHHREDSWFEPNRYVIIENTGDVDVKNPRIVINGRRNWFSAEDILSGIITDEMNDAEKAMAIFAFSSSIEIQCHDNNRRVGPYFPDVYYEQNDAFIRYGKKDYTRYDRSNPSRNDFNERANPVKAANCYYCGGCQYSAANFVILCRQAGLPARAVWMCPMDKYITHCVAEVWYDDGWHLFDPERRVFFLEADNLTVASYETLHNNPFLASRTHIGGFASRDKVSHAAEYEEYYPPSVMPVEKEWVSTMGMTLRPGEKFIWRWDNSEKFHTGNNPRNKGDLPYRLANGKMIYQPDLVQHVSRRGMLSELNIKTTYENGAIPFVHSDLNGSKSFVIYKVKAAYPIVGGIVGGEFYRKTQNDSCKIYVSVGDSDWIKVWSADQTGKFESHVSIDDIIDPLPSPERYEYYVKYEFKADKSSADAGLYGIYLESDVQMSGPSLPSLSVGENQIVYRDDTKGSVNVCITHGWEESAENKPPLSPAVPLVPANNSGIRLNSVQKLTWEEATDPDKHSIVDYHIQVSPGPDMLYPVSPNFDRILYSDKAEWDLPQGWLIPGKTYYWHVRAKDERGAWSAWSEIWSFSVH